MILNSAVYYHRGTPGKEQIERSAVEIDVIKSEGDAKELIVPDDP